MWPAEQIVMNVGKGASVATFALRHSFQFRHISHKERFMRRLQPQSPSLTDICVRALSIDNIFVPADLQNKCLHKTEENRFLGDELVEKVFLVFRELESEANC